MVQNKVAANLRAQIDANLKRVYDETLDEKVPDRFKELLEQLRLKEAKK
ncbi:MAG: NepR family anti-sigma factor [Paracoccaceae bacterium]